MASVDELEQVLALGREYGAALIEFQGIKVIFTEGSVPAEGELPEEDPEPPKDDYARLFKDDVPKFNRE